MAIRNILKYGEKGLVRKSRMVTDFNKRLHILLDDMHETLLDADGLGLAAPQVGVLRRVALIVDIDTTENEDSKENESSDDVADSVSIGEITNEQVIELINPEIIICNGEQTGNEGCLSMPGVSGIVTRPETVRIRAQDRNGNTFKLERSGLTARAICHEIDHLDGVMFTSIAERLLTSEEIAELAAEKERI
ncbi:MAG: peptide deformylase [Oscillospiraceae bacterium]|nr:peptide deformylase [Oscillospiraceae bacterium]